MHPEGQPVSTPVAVRQFLPQQGIDGYQPLLQSPLRRCGNRHRSEGSARTPRVFWWGMRGVKHVRTARGPVSALPMPRAMPLQRACGVLPLARRLCGVVSGRLWKAQASQPSSRVRRRAVLAPTTKPSLRPVAQRRTSHALESGHRKKDRPRHPCVRAEPAVGDTSRASGSHDNGAGIAWQRHGSPPRALGAGAGRSTTSLERRMCKHPQSPPFSCSRNCRCSD